MAEEESREIDIEIAVDGMPLGLTPFVRRLLSSTLLGMVSALKGGENAKTIEIKVRRKT